jgi:hypothetical protein
MSDGMACLAARRQDKEAIPIPHLEKGFSPVTVTSMSFL